MLDDFVKRLFVNKRMKTKSKRTISHMHLIYYIKNITIIIYISSRIYLAYDKIQYNEKYCQYKFIEFSKINCIFLFFF